MSIIINKPAQENLEEVLKNGSTATDPITLNLDNIGVGVTINLNPTPYERTAILDANSLQLYNTNTQQNMFLVPGDLNFTSNGLDPFVQSRYQNGQILYNIENFTVPGIREYIIRPNLDNPDGETCVLEYPVRNGRFAIMENSSAGLTIDTTSANQTLQVSQGNLTIPTVAIGVFFVNLNLFTFGDGLTVYIGKKTAGNLKFQATSGGTLHGNNTVSNQGLIIITRLGSDFYINQP